VVSDRLLRVKHIMNTFLRNLLLGLTLISLVSTTGCHSNTEYGPCVGIDSADRNPHLEYRLSTWNVILGVVFFEMVFPPILVVVNETYCPVGLK
jgi:hypothetical protein